MYNGNSKDGILKSVFIFSFGILHLLSCNYSVCLSILINLPLLNMLQLNYEKLVVVSPVVKKLENWSFYVVVLPGMTKKCTKSDNTYTQLLFCSLNLLFGDVLVAVAVVFCIRSLLFVPQLCLKIHLSCLEKISCLD